MNTEAFTTAAEPPKNAAPKQSATLTVRLTHSEREQLDHLAGDRPVSAFVRSRLFGKGGSRKAHRRRSTLDNTVLARTLATLGRTNLSADLNAIVWASETGKLSLDPKTTALVQQACMDIAAIRHELITALGLNAR